MLRDLGLLVVIVATGFLGVWILCRLRARRCPLCGARWSTELMGEWKDEEDWHCHWCGHWWSQRC